jgi:hypothetical protein
MYVDIASVCGVACAMLGCEGELDTHETGVPDTYRMYAWIICMHGNDASGTHVKWVGLVRVWL